MGLLQSPHSRSMAHRTFLALAVLSACLAACLGRTTSLGGPEGSQSSANSAD
ncbi:MAG: hypothetical protein JWL95_2713, partial [Gemmatimonadetes bacterium]|nr:hypothetical protein [Gemmatimonadota bacterium]